MDGGCARASRSEDQWLLSSPAVVLYDASGIGLVQTPTKHTNNLVSRSVPQLSLEKREESLSVLVV